MVKRRLSPEMGNAVSSRHSDTNEIFLTILMPCLDEARTLGAWIR
jgi:hypothetical protein